MPDLTQPIRFLCRFLAVCIFLCAGMAFHALSQTANRPGANSLPGPAITIVTPPSAYATGIPVNYIRSWQPLVPMTTEQAVVAGDAAHVQQTTQYADGLGRPLQTVARGVSPAGLDLVSPVVYDAFGREAYKYLPYAAENNGAFKINPFAQQQSSMQDQYPGEQVYYGQTDYEASPLNRVLKTFAPGNSWAGSQRGIATAYETAGANEVAIFTIGLDETALPVFQGYYGSGELFRTVATDEQGKRVVEYKDKEGQVVLKKVEIAAGAPGISDHYGWLCTYYIYDDLNQLRFVMPPLAVDAFRNSGWNPAGNSTAVNELCFRYAYDGRLRLIAKKVPGADWVHMVYDVRDRLVFTQDGNMRAKPLKQWLATIYDNLNHPVQTGILSCNSNRSALQDYVNSLGNNAAAVATSTYSSRTAGTPDILYVNVHDGRPLYKATSAVIFEGELEGSKEFETEIIGPDGIAFTSTQELNMNPVEPLPLDAAGYIPLTFTYYDNYNWTSKRYNASNDSKLGIGSNAWGEPLPGSTNEQVKGMVTGTRVRVLENAYNLELGAWLETASFYDSRGRVVQLQADNYKGGLDITTNRYDFTGKVISSYAVHNNPSGYTSSRVYTEMDYDHGGRLVEVRKTLDDNAATRRIMAHHEYDALGQLRKKELGQRAAEDNLSGASGYLETQEFTYNIRGWLKGLNWTGYNRGVTASVAIADRWFGMDLSYDWGYEHNQYNGNIAGMRWQSRGAGVERSYGYTYDAANRLLLADFKQLAGDGWNNTAGLDFSVNMGANGTDNGTAYDANGNILQMQQKGYIPGGGSDWIDNLQYHYFDYSNKLKAVGDQVDTDHKLGDFVDRNTGLDDYAYDVNGNLIKDKNKRIGEDPAGTIVYNHLNLPWLITVKDASGDIKGTITYIYDAAGNKLEKRVEELPLAGNNYKNKHTYTTYLSGHVYENNVLQFLGQEEGRIRPQRDTKGSATGVYYYDYYVKDHLGNVRLTLTDEHQADAYPVATLENGTLEDEKRYYDIPAASRVTAGSVHYPYAEGNSYVESLNGNSNKTGTSILLKVMAGDKVNIAADSWYERSPSSGDVSSLPVGELLSTLAGGISGAGGGSHSAAQLLEDGNLKNGLTSFLVQKVDADYANNGAGKPKAYLNYVLFDEQLNAVISDDGNNSGVSGVGDEGRQTPVGVSERLMTRNGYLYIFVSNETRGTDVVFDNLQVTHIRGPLCEETHYYPFGLTMAGISSRAAGKLQNRFRFNGASEFNSDLGLEWYETSFRTYDATIGRFHQVDILAHYFEFGSPYCFVGNNPILYSDPSGMAGNDSTAKPNSTVGFPSSNQPNILPPIVLEPGRNTFNVTPALVFAPAAPVPLNWGPMSLPQISPAAAGPAILGTLFLLSLDAALHPKGPLPPIGPPLTDIDLYNLARSRPDPFAIPGTGPISIPVTGPLVDAPVSAHQQYTLRAAANGQYPVYTWGIPIPTSNIYLSKGDVWKIGTTVDPKQRYSQIYLRSTGQGLYYSPEFFGTQDQVLFVEKMKLLNYIHMHNDLPPGNKELK
ncbi:DUF6443 domain-containing protein [Filimonas effusa]|uniref:DUF6443 domain-containing protein n=1 Tax=Filimonas effusa TaxID=2508721 RepID=A0A4Q1DCQ4_9BACT|nr:DUF6443 domain-containing protein [Filimonas effusa]RXK86635.1 hypothetical protein ESB13_07475 [Filimonas effusa]